MKLSISDLLQSKPGTAKEYTVELPEFEDAEFKVEPNQKVLLKAYRIEDGIAVTTQPEEIQGKAICMKTMKKFILDTTLRETEWQYYLKMPEEVDPEEARPIDPKTHTIDVEELLKEAIFLGLPIVIECPEAHKIPIKTKTENYQEVESPSERTYKAFEGLKDILEDEQEE